MVSTSKIVRTIAILLAMLLVGLLTSCSLDEPAYNKNYQIEWEGEHPETLSMKIGSGDWKEIPNDGSIVNVDFDIEQSDKEYKLYNLTFQDPKGIDAVFFNGFYNIVYDEDGNAISSTNMEMDFDSWDGKSFSCSGRLNEHNRYNLFVTRYD